MSTKLKIKVTKEILERSKYCVTDYGQNCAIALAVRDIFPYANVTSDHISPFQYDDKLSIFDACLIINDIELPTEATQFIVDFDGNSPEARITMPEFEFEVEIPDSVINQINIDELKPLLINHPTLELI